ncbi:MAG: isochorismatase family cysteine hydrolase [Synergistaceae bacterium]|nr:isochorismatase family cysteine hydrolase [Synergistaceae bacterium]
MKVLIIVDMQHDFIDGSLGTKEAVAIVPRVLERVKYFDGYKIFTQDTHGADYLQTEEGKNLPVPHCIKGTKGWQILPELLTHADEPALEKETFGSMELGKKLQKLNQKEKVESIELLGLCTDICVMANALIAKTFMPNTPIFANASCSAGVTPESHERALQAMEVCHIKRC